MLTLGVAGNTSTVKAMGCPTLTGQLKLEANTVSRNVFSRKRLYDTGGNETSNVRFPTALTLALVGPDACDHTTTGVELDGNCSRPRQVNGDRHVTLNCKPDDEKAAYGMERYNEKAPSVEESLRHEAETNARVSDIVTPAITSEEAIAHRMPQGLTLSDGDSVARVAETSRVRVFVGVGGGVDEFVTVTLFEIEMEWDC